VTTSRTDSEGDPVMAPEVRVFEQAPNESWPRDALTTPDPRPIRVRARVVWSRSGEELLEGRATRWSGR
jgi:hypothetical protein